MKRMDENDGNLHIGDTLIAAMALRGCIERLQANNGVHLLMQADNAEALRQELIGLIDTCELYVVEAQP